MKTRLNRLLKPTVAAIAVATLAAGCATKSPDDPFENYNRMMFSVNDALDTYLFKPVAKGYDFVMPDIAQKGITNFFGNISDVWSAFNNFLSGEGERGVTDLARVTVNSIFGLGGLIDVATDLKITRYKADFGYTLASWSMEAGPYVVLPILGPSTARDTLATPLDYWVGDPWAYVEKIRVRNIGIVVRAVNYRSSLLHATDIVEDASLDKYEFVRDSYLQHRYNAVNNHSNQKDEWQDVSASAPIFKPGAVTTKAKKQNTENK